MDVKADAWEEATGNVSRLLFRGKEENLGVIHEGGLRVSVSCRKLLAAVTDVSGTSVRHYNLATGSYGATITSDATPTAQYAVIGVDTVLHRVLLAHWTSNAAKQLEVWDIATNTEVSQAITLPSSQDVLLGGRVDQVRHRAALLVWAQPGNADEVLPLDMTTGSLGTPIQLDPAVGSSAGYYDTIDLDQTTGHVQVAHLNNVGTAGSIFCLGANSLSVLNVNLDSSMVTTSGSTSLISRCGYAFAADQQGGSGWLLFHNSASINFPRPPSSSRSTN